MCCTCMHLSSISFRQTIVCIMLHFSCYYFLFHLFNPFSSYFYSCKYGIYYSTPLYFSSITDKHSLFIRFSISDGVNLFLHFRKTKSVQIFELFNFFFHGKIKFENEKRALSIKKNNLNNQ